MNIPIITQNYLSEPEEDQVRTGGKRLRPRSKYEFKGSQSHRCSLVAVCEDNGRTTVKWSSVRVGRDTGKKSCTKTTSANGGLSLTSPSLGDPPNGKEVGNSPLYFISKLSPNILLLNYVLFINLMQFNCPNIVIIGGRIYYYWS